MYYAKMELPPLNLCAVFFKLPRLYYTHASRTKQAQSREGKPNLRVCFLSGGDKNLSQLSFVGLGKVVVACNS